MRQTQVRWLSSWASSSYTRMWWSLKRCSPQSNEPKKNSSTFDYKWLDGNKWSREATQTSLNIFVRNSDCNQLHPGTVLPPDDAPLQDLVKRRTKQQRSPAITSSRTKRPKALLSRTKSGLTTGLPLSKQPTSFHEGARGLSAAKIRCVTSDE